MPEDVVVTLAELEAARHGWSRQLSPVRAIVRCERAERDRCLDLLGRFDCRPVAADGYAAIGLIGPRAQELLDTVAHDSRSPAPIILRQAAGSFELLVDAARGPTLWSLLLEAGAPLQVACVGLDALENLAASRHFLP